MLGENLAAELATSLLHIGGLSGAAAHLAINYAFGVLSVSLPDALSIILLAVTRILCDIVRIQIQKSLEKKREARAKPAQEEDQNG
jgi:hypothetical protein